MPANRMASCFSNMDFGPFDGLTGRVNHDAVNRHGPWQLEVGPLPIDRNLDLRRRFVVEPEMGAWSRTRRDHDLPRRDVHGVAPVGIGLDRGHHTGLRLLHESTR